MVFSIFICLFCVVFETTRGSCKKGELKTCKEDEYFDVILCLCSRCADICEPRPDKSTQTECEQNCPDYSRQIFTVKSFSEVTRVDHSKQFLNNSTVTVSTTAVVAQSLDNDSLIKKPLFWTSVVSVLISVVATIVLIILCICKKSQPARNLFCRRSPYPQPMQKLSVAQTETGSETGNFQGMVHSTKMYRYESGLSNRYSISKDGRFINLSQDHCTDCFIVQPETFSSGGMSSFVQKPGVASFEGSSLIRTSMIGFNLMDDKEAELSSLIQSTLRNKCSYEYEEQAEQRFHMESLTNQKVPYRFSTESGFNDDRSCCVPSEVAGVSLVDCSVF